MSLPEFTDTGDLPVGVHVASLVEVTFQLGKGSSRRKALALRLQRIYQIAAETGELRRFVVFGSFVTSTSRPNDVDVMMVMEDNFNVDELDGESAILFDHAVAQSHFGASVFWVRRVTALGGEQAAIEFWQTKRDGTQRGIVEIVEEGEVSD